jgi:hypothetical protein
MILHVFSVYDKAVGAHLPPFYARSKGEALRSFSDACNDSKHQFYQHGLDYVLVFLGEFNDVGGIFSCGEPVRILSATECKVEDNTFSEETGSEDLPQKTNGPLKRLPM